MLNNVPEDDEQARTGKDAPPSPHPRGGAGTGGQAPPAPARSRMPPEERRRQLVGIGLSLLRERPLDAITVDEVARRAGISRGLLFHYFASKQAFHREVAAAGLRRLHRAMWPADERPAGERLRGAIDGYLAFVERRPGRVMEMAGGSWSADPELAAILRDARAAIADGLLAAADDGREAPTDGPRARLRTQSARAWLAFAEQLALDWVAEPTVDREALVEHLEASFRATTG